MLFLLETAQKPILSRMSYGESIPLTSCTFHANELGTASLVRRCMALR